MFKMAQGIHQGMVPHDDSVVSQSFLSDILTRGPTERESAKCVPTLNPKRSVAISAEDSREVKKARSKSLQYVCSVSSCGEKFYNSEQLDTHLKLHLGVKPFACNMCGKVCQTESKLKAHQSTHVNDGVKPVCDICERSFSSRSSLNKHKKMLHKPKPHLCPLCNSGFEERKYMVVHAGRAHNLNLPLEVEDTVLQSTVNCGMNGFGPSETSEASKNVCSESCSMPLDDVSSPFSTHPNNVNNLQRKSSLMSYDDSGSENKMDTVSCAPINCELCTSTFPSLTYLKQHMAVHENEKRYACQSCTLHFYCQEDLDMHMRLHTVGNKSHSSPLLLESGTTGSQGCEKYTCAVCQEHFANLGSLKRHQAKGHTTTDLNTS